MTFSFALSAGQITEWLKLVHTVVIDHGEEDFVAVTSARDSVSDVFVLIGNDACKRWSKRLSEVRSPEGDRVQGLSAG